MKLSVLSLFLLLAGCQSCAGPSNDAFKACAKTVAKAEAVPAATSALVCGDDRECLENAAEQSAARVADKLLVCAQSAQDAGTDK